LQKIADKGIGNFRTQQLNKIFRRLSTAKIDPEFFKKVSGSMQSLLPKETGSDNSQQNQLNVLLRRELHGTLDSKFQAQIKDGLFALDCLSPGESVPSLLEFTKAFEKHFEGQSLPLLAALDPETGVGYLERLPDGDNPLLETVNIQHNANPQTSVNWTAAHSYLLDCWQKIRGDATRVIQLEQLALAGLKTGSHSTQVQGLSVLFRIVNDQLYIESAGGVNALALMGRFYGRRKRHTGNRGSYCPGPGSGKSRYYFRRTPPPVRSAYRQCKQPGKNMGMGVTGYRHIHQRCRLSTGAVRSPGQHRKQKSDLKVD